jgi:hypothetical protein
VHVALIGATRNEGRILVERPLGNPRRRLEDNGYGVY